MSNKTDDFNSRHANGFLLVHNNKKNKILRQIEILMSLE